MALEDLAPIQSYSANHNGTKLTKDTLTKDLKARLVSMT
jgi:hypothetical protein